MIKSPGVRLETGDGGGATGRFVREELVRRFSNSSLDELEDGAVFVLGDAEFILTTDAYIVDPPIFPGGDIGRLAVSGAVNDLLACGAVPRALLTTIVVSEGFPLDSLSTILDSLKDTAEEAGVHIIGGDTKVVEKSNKVAIHLTSTGIGVPVRKGRRFRLVDAQPGDAILISGFVGDHGLAVLSKREGLGFEHRIQSDCAPLGELILPLIRTVDGIHSLRDPTRGGLIGVLHDIAESSRLEVWFHPQRVPIRHEVRAASEMLGLDACEVANEGKMVVVAARDDAERALSMLRASALGKDAAIIGGIRQPRNAPGLVIACEDGVERIRDRREGSVPPRLC